jgi:hypothetical protein
MCYLADHGVTKPTLTDGLQQPFAAAGLFQNAAGMRPGKSRVLCTADGTARVYQPTVVHGCEVPVQPTGGLRACAELHQSVVRQTGLGL